jgi:hypothetical protein
MGWRTLYLSGLILTLIFSLQLVTACGGGGQTDLQAATSGASTPAAPVPVATQEPGNTQNQPAGTLPGSGGILNQADLDRLKATKSCPACNLYGADLAGADLGLANLGGADLRGAILAGVNLSGANLGGSRLSGANLSGADLSRANLQHSQLDNANLTGANLTNADLKFWVDLSFANLTGANLTRADLSAGSQYPSYANLNGADLSSAILSGTVWIDGRICKDTSIGQCQ